jgi:hypothetical protein
MRSLEEKVPGYHCIKVALELHVADRLHHTHSLHRPKEMYIRRRIQAALETIRLPVVPAPLAGLLDRAS